MREYWILTKIQLLSLFGINKLRHSGDEEANKKRRRGILMLAVVAIAFGNMSVTYSGMLAVGLKPIGALPLMLGLMMMASSALVLMMTVFSGKNVLFAFGDYDMQMSWPVSVRAIASSRFTTMYAYNIAYTLLLLLPAGVIYAVHALPPLWYYPLFLVLMLLVPAIPTAIGCILSIGIAVLTAGRRANAMLTSVLQIVAALAIMFLSMRSSVAIENIASVAEQLSDRVGGLYPFALWFQNALADGDGVSLLLFAASCLAAIAAVVLLLGALLKPIGTRLITRHHTGKAYRTGNERRSGMVTALFRKELKRYFASAIYVTNTLFGMVMLIIGGVAALIIGADRILPLLTMAGMDVSILPLLLGVLLLMSCTTNSSISMEGKQLWIVKSLPIPVRELFLSKILVNIVVILLPCWVGATMLGIALHTSGIDWLYLYLLPAAYVCFDAVFGLFVNLNMPKFDWKNETEVVKQSSACFVTLMGGMGISIVPIALYFVIGQSWIYPVCALVLFAVAYVLWRRLMKSGERKMLML